jgi:N6-adenosine-specific RNA methylase IME4
MNMNAASAIIYQLPVREPLHLVHLETGELLLDGEESLNELADQAREILTRHERDAWELGRVVSKARLRCERKDCGIDGPNPDARFGRWVSENFSDTSQVRSLYNARRLWEVFSERREEVSFIPQSGLYALAEPKCDEAREELIAELRAATEEGATVRVRDVKGAIKQMVSVIKQASEGITPVAPEDACTTEDLTRLVADGRRYGCIYADPPWQYGNQGTRAATGNHYSGMAIEELMAMPIQDLAADNAHLHLWTTNAFLFESLKIMEAWGFEYKSCFVWVKPQMGLGNYWRVSHEFMLFGLRGKKPFGSRSEMSWGQYPRSIHSRKPDEIRKKIETVSGGPYLELFGRMPVRGWTVYGNQIARDMLTSVEVDHV